MPDTAIENAVSVRDDRAQKIAEAERQIREWRTEIERVERFIVEWEVFSRLNTPQDASAMAHPPRGVVNETPVKPINPKKEEVAAEVRDILMANKAPMTRDELLKMLSKRGKDIQGKNPAVVLQTMLWRMQSVIVHLKGYGYWPTDEPYESAGYHPHELSNDEAGAPGPDGNQPGEEQDRDNDLLGPAADLV